jgi:hypothetical protein
MKSDDLRKLIPKQLSPEQMIEIIVDLYEIGDRVISDMILDRVQRPEPIELKAVIETIDAMCAVLNEHNAAKQQPAKK